VSGTSAGASVPSSTVAPFPRTARDTAKPVGEAADPAAADKPIIALEPAGQPTAPSSSALSKTDAAAAQAEALLDAVVDMVQQQPSSLSVFTSGASFISGVGDKKVSDVIKAAAASSAASNAADGSGTPGAPPKLDRAAAELLRPMLRQWLADNMGRILEEALRSELTEQTQGGGKEPGKG
jgi:cell pole-organizing protein PopZ